MLRLRVAPSARPNSDQVTQRGSGDRCYSRLPGALETKQTTLNTFAELVVVRYRSAPAVNCLKNVRVLSKEKRWNFLLFGFAPIIRRGQIAWFRAVSACNSLCTRHLESWQARLSLTNAVACLDQA